MFDAIDSLRRLRTVLDSGRRRLTLAQIELLQRRLDYASQDDMAEFREAFAEVFPEFCGGQRGSECSKC